MSRRALLSATTGLAFSLAVQPSLASAAPLVLSESSAASVSGRPDPELGFEARVEEFTLPNGLHVIVLPRRNAPVVSCHTLANVGAWDERPGETGIAHLLEHMAFKGTPRVGTRDFRREAPLLDALDEVFYDLRAATAAQAAETGNGAAAGAGGARVEALRAKLLQLKAEVGTTVWGQTWRARLQQPSVRFSPRMGCDGNNRGPYGVCEGAACVGGAVDALVLCWSPLPLWAAHGVVRRRRSSPCPTRSGQVCSVRVAWASTPPPRTIRCDLLWRGGLLPGESVA